MEKWKSGVIKRRTQVTKEIVGEAMEKYSNEKVTRGKNGSTISSIEDCKLFSAEKLSMDNWRDFYLRVCNLFRN